jgi:hypothetical protein
MTAPTEAIERTGASFSMSKEPSGPLLASSMVWISSKLRLLRNQVHLSWLIEEPTTNRSDDFEAVARIDTMVLRVIAGGSLGAGLPSTQSRTRQIAMMQTMLKEITKISGIQVSYNKREHQEGSCPLRLGLN